ncbi:MAG: GntR family transcriptional regulator [Burkholderiaceae bacterium]
MTSKPFIIAASLKEQILSGHWRPGERLTERTLCERMSAGRSSVREALQQLLQEGFVENEPNRGYRVATLNASEAADIYQVRSVLEGLAARNFINMATEAQRSALQESLDALEVSVEAGDVKAQLAAIELFYSVLLSGCYNLVLKSTLESLHSKISRLRATSILSPGRIRNTLKEMRRIGDAIRDNDEEAAFHACLAHMQYTSAVAIRMISTLKVKG